MVQSPRLAGPVHRSPDARGSSAIRRAPADYRRTGAFVGGDTEHESPTAGAGSRSWPRPPARGLPPSRKPPRPAHRHESVSPRDVHTLHLSQNPRSACVTDGPREVGARAGPLAYLPGGQHIARVPANGLPITSAGAPSRSTFDISSAGLAGLAVDKR